MVGSEWQSASRFGYAGDRSTMRVLKTTGYGPSKDNTAWIITITTMYMWRNSSSFAYEGSPACESIKVI